MSELPEQFKNSMFLSLPRRVKDGSQVVEASFTSEDPWKAAKSSDPRDAKRPRGHRKSLWQTNFLPKKLTETRYYPNTAPRRTPTLDQHVPQHRINDYFKASRIAAVMPGALIPDDRKTTFPSLPITKKLGHAIIAYRTEIGPLGDPSTRVRVVIPHFA